MDPAQDMDGQQMMYGMDGGMDGMDGGMDGMDGGMDGMNDEQIQQQMQMNQLMVSNSKCKCNNSQINTMDNNNSMSNKTSNNIKINSMFILVISNRRTTMILLKPMNS